jgi:hypothetical protein
VQRGVAWLLKVRGQESHLLAKWRYRLFDRHVRFDPNKYGWPWTQGAASWIVPTSYSLIALRLAFGCCLPPAVKERIDNAAAMLFDRGCPGGGWNAGNGMAFDVPLEPHIDVTSLALPDLAPKRVSISRIHLRVMLGRRCCCRAQMRHPFYKGEACRSQRRAFESRRRDGKYGAAGN